MDQALAVLVVHDIKNSLALLEADLEQLNHSSCRVRLRTRAIWCASAPYL